MCRSFSPSHRALVQFVFHWQESPKNWSEDQWCAYPSSPHLWKGAWVVLPAFVLVLVPCTRAAWEYEALVHLMYMANPPQTPLAKEGVYGGDASSLWDSTVRNAVLPGDSVHWWCRLCSQPFWWDLGASGFSRMLRKLRHVGCRLSNPLSFSGVQKGGASDNTTKVDKAVDHFKCIVLDEERWGNASTLSRDFVFLEAGGCGQAEVITGIQKAIEEVMEIVVTLTNQSCIIGKQKVSEENLADFGFLSESGKIEKFAISAGTERNAGICCSKGIFEEHREENSKEGWEPAHSLVWLCCEYWMPQTCCINSNSTVHVVVERLQKKKLWRTTDGNR